MCTYSMFPIFAEVVRLPGGRNRNGALEMFVVEAANVVG